MERAEVLHGIFPQFLLARLTFKNPRSQRPEEMTSHFIYEMYPWWKRIKSGAN